MAAIKLFGATITVQRPFKGGCDNGRDLTMTKTARAPSPSSSSSLSDQGGVGDRTKKPNKIIPCPRCESTETKFCYFNNYNVNQPRHFCRGCHRYWTAGGALRNVPIGAGRRKSKPPPSTPHQLCRAAGEWIYEDWRAAEQGSHEIQLQRLVGIKRMRRRTGIDCDYEDDAKY